MVRECRPVVTPIYGWGYMEAIDGELSPAFEVKIHEAGIDVGDGVRGWRGRVVSPNHKYCGMAVQMTPRHVERSNVVVVWVLDGSKSVFSGMADTTGLEKTW